MLNVRQLAKSYPTRSGPLNVLQDVSLAMQRGDALAVLGPSGSGKSTLLHILGTLDRPSSGRVTLDDKDPFTLDEPALAEFRNRHVGFVYQDHHLLPQCSVLENILVPTLARRDRPSDIDTWAGQLIEMVGLKAREAHRPAELSGGERQRVAVARALINRPTLLLADEPTGNLDRTNAAAVGALLLDVARNQNTILITVTHSAELAAQFPRRAEMNDGRLRFEEPEA